ncbi:MAG: efflux RND transporter permease subunit [Gammaproteobacteria bacterium]|nr:efflux RND transporter permease subunit [Gammaproteobacteria bacterium]
MSLAELSIKRPVFITCIVTLLLVVGYISIKKMPVNMFPDVEFPIVSVYTAYPGAAPSEIETQISKVIEDEVSTIANIKSVKSISTEGASQVILEFNLGTKIQEAQQKTRDKINNIRNQLPNDAKEPLVQIFDPASNPIMILGLTGEMDTNRLYDIADEKIKSAIEQTNNVGLVEIMGGRDEEIIVSLDRKKLKTHNISAVQVAKQIGLAGENIPVGKFSNNGREIIFRTIGEYNSINDINNTIVNFVGNDIPVKVSEVGEVNKGYKDEQSKTYINGKPAVFILIFRQSGANIVSVVKTIKNKLPELNTQLQLINPSLQLTSVRNDAKIISANIRDVKETILIGIILTIIVVYFFLGSLRSTLITGLALPTSLLGAFILMNLAGFSINVMSLLALSLAVGLLIDDAIVVRENIFRHIEHGATPMAASINGTREVSLAVIGTTLTILAVFGPVAFLYGIVGQFFKEFGLTICFAMVISLFDALTIAPMLSTYFAGRIQSKQEIRNNNKSRLNKFLNSVIILQDWLEIKYVSVLQFTLKRPAIILISSVILFISSIISIGYLSKTFLPAQDHGEFGLNIKLSPGDNLESMDKTSHEIIKTILTIPEIEQALTIVGTRDGSTNKASFFISLVDSDKRKLNTTQVKKVLEEKLKPFTYATPIITDIDMVGAGMRPFNLNISGPDQVKLDEISDKVFQSLKNNPGLTSVEISSSNGKPEVQVKLDNQKAESLGISSKILGQELRTQIDGNIASILRENGKETDIRVRVEQDQRDLTNNFENIYIPNINNTLLKISSFAHLYTTTGPVSINRENKERYVLISADTNPEGPGMAQVIKDVKDLFANEIKLPPGMKYDFMGQSESFQELIDNMVIALLLGLLFIYLVLASLYESFIVPITIMLVIPLAVVGAFFSLLITQHSLDLFSMIGCIMLLGLATKNSILLVDYANQKLREGYNRYDAIIEAGRTRLRPILMTTVALIAGMIPVAVGINEASKQRTSMGIAIIGGLISSTLLTLVVIPAAFSYIDQMRTWGRRKLKLKNL